MLAQEGAASFDGRTHVLGVNEVEVVLCINPLSFGVINIELYIGVATSLVEQG